MSVLAFVPNDGHTLTGWINEIPGLHPRIEFSYRRLTCEEFGEYLQKVERFTEVQAQRLIAAHLAARITRWDVTDDKGQPVEIKEEIMRKLVRTLAQRLWRVVAGLEGPDGLVGQAKSDEDADFRAACEAARSGKALALVEEEQQRKNSPAA